MCRRTVLDADGVVLDADSATSDADSDDSQPKKAPDVSAAELPPEELWQVHGAYYNLESFAKHHPGGVEQIIAQKGKDCTTLFETVHLFDEQPRKVLRKYYVRDVPDYEPTLGACRLRTPTRCLPCTGPDVITPTPPSCAQSGRVTTFTRR